MSSMICKMQPSALSSWQTELIVKKQHKREDPFDRAFSLFERRRHRADRKIGDFDDRLDGFSSHLTETRKAGPQCLGGLG
ncbi:MAG: hypothetical protein JWL84_1868 [Rhodospirillales bacterium]|nr:hypothetical protein [Rhodospirillales bacterium]